MRKLSGMLGRRHEVRPDPIRVVQDALSDVATMSLSSMTTALDAIVEQDLWRQDRPFESFGDFAVALPPLGLGVRALAPLRVLRHALWMQAISPCGPTSSSGWLVSVVGRAKSSSMTRILCPSTRYLPPRRPATAFCWPSSAAIPAISQRYVSAGSHHGRRRSKRG